MIYPGVDDALFVGFAQATPTLFPFVECQARLVGAYAVGQYQPPPVDEMRRVIAEDQEFYTGHMVHSARHTQQLDYFLYEHDMRTKELPAGRRRAAEIGAPGRAGVAERLAHSGEPLAESAHTATELVTASDGGAR